MDKRFIRVKDGIANGIIPVSYNSVERWAETQVFPGLVSYRATNESSEELELYWDSEVWREIQEKNAESLSEELPSHSKSLAHHHNCTCNHKAQL